MTRLLTSFHLQCNFLKAFSTFEFQAKYDNEFAEIRGGKLPYSEALCFIHAGFLVRLASCVEKVFLTLSKYSNFPPAGGTLQRRATIVFAEGEISEKIGTKC